MGGWGHCFWLVLTGYFVWLEVAGLFFLCDPPHLASDGAVYAVGADDDVSGVHGTVFRVDVDAVLVELDEVDALIRQDPVLVLELVEEDLDDGLAVNEYLGVSDTITMSVLVESPLLSFPFLNTPPPPSQAECV